MIKFYCDHCRKDITGENMNELDAYDTFLVNGVFVGSGSVLCDECYTKRSEAHAQLDRDFLHLPGSREPI